MYIGLGILVSVYIYSVSNWGDLKIKSTLCVCLASGFKLLSLKSKLKGEWNRKSQLSSIFS